MERDVNSTYRLLLGLRGYTSTIPKHKNLFEEQYLDGITIHCVTLKEVNVHTCPQYCALNEVLLTK